MSDYAINVKLRVDEHGFVTGMESAIDKTEQFSDAAQDAGRKGGTSMVALGNIAANIVAKAFDMVKSSVSGAIQRLDTLNNFKPVMESLGFSASTADASIEKLSSGIEGLPTTLSEIVANTQLLTASLGDLEKGTDTAIALNNMFLAGGQGAEAASRALTQYNQMLAKGKVDQQSWNTLMEVAPGQLNQLAQELLSADANGRDLYAALQDGTISLDEFNNAIIKLNAEGGDTFSSFADQALKATGGIGTAMKNIGSAVTKGVANIIDEFDMALKAAKMPGIAESLNKVKAVINTVFNAIAKVVGALTKTLAPAIKFLSENIQVVIVALTGFAAALAITKIVSKVSAALKIAEKALAAYKTQTVEAAAVQAGENAQLTLGQIALLLLAGRLKLAEAAQLAFNTVVKANPLGFTLTLITAVATALTFLDAKLGGPISKWKEHREELKAFNEQTQETIDSTHDLITGFEADRDAMAQADGQTNALVSQITSLNSALQSEGLTTEEAAEKKEKLLGLVEQLNSRVEDLGLAWDEEKGALNMGNNELRERVSLYQKAAKAAAYQKAMQDAYEQELELNKQIKEAQDKRVEANNKAIERFNELTAAGMNNEDALLAIQSERNEVQLYDDQLAELKGSYAELEQSVTEYADAVAGIDTEKVIADAEAVKQAAAEETQARLNTTLQVLHSLEQEKAANEEMIASGTMVYERLTETNQALVDSMKAEYEEYYNAATDMFNAISTESDRTAQTMIETLSHNVEATREMGNNMQDLRTRFEDMGLDEAILNQFESMGPSAAGEIKNLAAASDEELKQLASLYEEAGKESVDAYEKALDVPDMGGVKNLVTNVETNLGKAVADADFSELPKAIIDGVMKGLGDDAEAVSAAKQLALDLKLASAQELGIASPSKVFKEMGKYSVMGIALGITGNMSQAIAAVRTMAASIIQATRLGLSGMNAVGIYAAQGLAIGLQDGAGQIYAVAAQIAANITRTLEKATKVGSPSKVTEEIGMWIGKGLAVGMLNTMDIIESAADAMARVAIPDLNAGTMQLAAAGGLAGGGSSSYMSEYLNQPINITVISELDGKKVGEGTAVYSRAKIRQLDREAAMRRGER